MRRLAYFLTSVLLVVLATPTAASAALLPLPGPIDVVGTVGDLLSGVAGDGVRAITQWVASGAAWLVERSFVAMEQTTDPHLGSAWFTESYARMTLIGIALSAPCFLLGLLQALIHRDGAVLGRVLAALPGSALLTGGAVGVTGLLLSATDQASAWLVAASGRDLSAFGTTLAKAFAVSPDGSMFVLFLVSVVSALAALLLWVELLIRASLVYVLLGFFPLVAATMVWPAAASSMRRMVRLLVAVVLSKLVAVGVVCMGIAAVSSGGSAAVQFQGLLVGCGMIAIACFAPVAVHRLLPLLEESVQVRGSVTVGGGTRSAMQAQSIVASGQRARSALSAHRSTQPPAGRGGPAGGAGGMRVAGGGI